MGSKHNSLFSIKDDQLILNQPLSSEDLIPEYFVRLQSVDKGGAYIYKNFSFPVNHFPAQIEASTSPFSESIYGGTVVAQLSVSDVDSFDSHVFKLVDGDGDFDNHRFNIVNDQIVINHSPDYEQQSTYSIRVSAVDATNLHVDQILEFNVLMKLSNPCWLPQT